MALTLALAVSEAAIEEPGSVDEERLFNVSHDSQH